jgi:hypothetical protein
MIWNIFIKPLKKSQHYKPDEKQRSASLFYTQKRGNAQQCGGV